MKSFIDKVITPDMWKVFGDFPCENGDFCMESGKITYETSKFVIKTEYKEDDFGVLRLSGEFTAKDDIVLRNLNLLINIGGGEIDVYTQYNGCLNESRGAWQRLNTAILAEGRFSRTSAGAAPFMALWREQTKRGFAIHLLPDFAWEMKASYVPSYDYYSNVVVEIGINRENLSLSLKKGESIKTPDVILYEFTNKLDMDSFKLHNYWHNNYSKKPIPITYNTWLSNFDKISYENVTSQIEIASRLGVEYFVIDAGWFGKGDNWWYCRGDWDENLTGGLCGRMLDVSNDVRAHNMKFGLWFEIESADTNSDVVKNHPEYFIIRDNLCFLDFSNEDARAHILEVLSKNIEKYNIEYIKFDYNQDMRYDDRGRAYIDYFKGYFETIKELKSKYPGIFFENCASGGQRMNLRNCIDFDGFWPSDNESPYEQLRMFKDTVLRLPPQYFDRWVTISSMENFSPVYENQEKEKILASNDSTWDGIVGVHKSFLHGFLTGGQVGISCDLTKFSEDLILSLKEHISKVKVDRDFWNNAVCRILASTDEILVIEFSDMSLNEIKVIAFSFKTRQNSLYVYPKLDENSKYLLEDTVIEGVDVAKNGIEIKLEGNYRAACIELRK